MQDTEILTNTSCSIHQDVFNTASSIECSFTPKIRGSKHGQSMSQLSLHVLFKDAAINHDHTITIADHQTDDQMNHESTTFLNPLNELVLSQLIQFEKKTCKQLMNILP
jgi:hypothetical protein